MLKEGMDMDPNEGVQEEMHEVERELAEREKEAGKHGNTVSPYALEMGVNGRTPRSKGRFPTPPRSPSMSPGRSPTRSPNSVLSFVQGLNNLLSLLLSPAWVQTFVMTFLGEWGDRSQIATIAMAAGQDYWWVILGATAGHCICTGVAVLGGRAIAGRVSLKVGMCMHCSTLFDDVLLTRSQSRLAVPLPSCYSASSTSLNPSTHKVHAWNFRRSLSIDVIDPFR
jgi:putative Ca2+/H+ antiporter (TMEM165/GDT1 family)